MTKHFLRLLTFCLFGSIFSQSVIAQEQPEDPSQGEIQRPEASAPVCLKIINNYITASGGAEAHSQLKNIQAQGTVIEAGSVRNFELIETSEGKRRLTYKWRHLGRNYTEIFGTNGEEIWTHQTQPKLEFPKLYTGIESSHFAKQFWFLHPTLSPLAEHVVFEYQGAAKVAGRETHLIVAYNAKNVRTWFYFDKETFLPIRWGGLGNVAGIAEYVDYRSIRFEAVHGVMLPKAIDLLIEDNAFGEIKFTSIQSNVEIDDTLFEMPVQESPVLRQKTTLPTETVTAE